MTRHIRNGRGSIRPYIYGPLALEAFVVATFEPEEVERNDNPTSRHLELVIGDSVLTLSLWKAAEPPAVNTASTYVYVTDADATYARALEAGAVSVREPATAPFGERICTVRDVAGNIWFIATYLGSGSRQTP